MIERFFRKKTKMETSITQAEKANQKLRETLNQALNSSNEKDRDLLIKEAKSLKDLVELSLAQAKTAREIEKEMDLIGKQLGYSNRRRASQGYKPLRSPLRSREFILLLGVTAFAIASMPVVIRAVDDLVENAISEEAVKELSQNLAMGHKSSISKEGWQVEVPNYSNETQYYSDNGRLQYSILNKSPWGRLNQLGYNPSSDISIDVQRFIRAEELSPKIIVPTKNGEEKWLLLDQNNRLYINSPIMNQRLVKLTNIRVNQEQHIVILLNNDKLSVANVIPKFKN